MVREKRDIPSQTFKAREDSGYLMEKILLGIVTSFLCFSIFQGHIWDIQNILKCFWKINSCYRLLILAIHLLSVTAPFEIWPL